MYQIIKQAFLAYATIPAQNPLLGPQMSEKEVILMLEECSVLDGSNPEHLSFVTKVLVNLGTPFITSQNGKHDITALVEAILKADDNATAGQKSINSPSATLYSAIKTKHKAAPPPVQLNTIPSVCFSVFLECLLKTAVISLDQK